jgi:hypothetical protein
VYDALSYERKKASSLRPHTLVAEGLVEGGEVDVVPEEKKLAGSFSRPQFARASGLHLAALTKPLRLQH